MIEIEVYKLNTAPMLSRVHGFISKTWMCGCGFLGPVNAPALKKKQDKPLPCQDKFWGFATNLWKDMDIDSNNIAERAHEAAVEYLAKKVQSDSWGPRSKAQPAESETSLEKNPTLCCITVFLFFHCFSLKLSAHVWFESQNAGLVQHSPTQEVAEMRCWCMGIWTFDTHQYPDFDTLGFHIEPIGI